MKKRILFLINSFVIGGAERVFIAQANELSDRGWDVHVVTLFSQGPLARDVKLGDDHLHNLAAASLFDIPALFRLRRILKKKEISLVYSTLNEANTVGRFLKLLRPSLQLFTRESNMADVKPLLYKLIDILFGMLSKRIIAVSAAVGTSIRAYAPWLRSKIVVLYNGVQLPTDTTHRSSTGLLKLLTVGSLTPKKDHAILIDAMTLLPEHFLLTIAGSGALQRKLQEQANSLGLQTRVAFSGAVSPERLDDLYRSNDVFVLPSSREGCPNVISEAQSFSLPTVAFDIPGMREFVDDSSGILVEERTAEALAQAIEACAEPEKRNSLGRGGFEKVSRERNFGHQTDTLVSLFESAR